MAEIVTEVVKMILEKPVSKAYKEIMFTKDLDSHINSVQRSTTTIEATLLDANASGSCNHSQQDVLNKLGCTLVRWENFHDEKATRAKQKELMGGSRLTTEVRLFFSNKNQILVQVKDAQRVKAIRGDLDIIAKDYAQYGNIISMLSQNQAQSLSQETGPHPMMADVIIGRNADRNRIITMLCDSLHGQESLCVAAIVGIGGQGKTTLAQYVYNGESVKGCFEVYLWVYCTLDITVRELLEKILASAIDDKPVNCEMVQLQNRISRVIGGKKFFLVLDNIWDQESLSANWLGLRKLLGVGAKGSKVLVTTRSEKVARIMSPLDPYMLNDLDTIDSWFLFKHFAFNERQELGVEAIGKEILKMIPKVTLVIRVVGQQLAHMYTIKQWQGYKEELAAKSSFKGHDMIMQTLKLSYDRLDEKLKLCLAYCSLFPKGWEFDIDLMVRLWIALGYVETGRQSLEEVGEEYVCCLVSHGFIKFFGGIYFVMHDVIHDLMLSIAQSKYQMVDFKRNDIDERVSHIYFGSDLDVPCWVFHIKNQLRSIINLEPKTFHRGWNQLISRNGGLKVLGLREMEIEKVPRSIGELLCLRYLDLSDNAMCKLPNSITQLANLISLDLSRCYDLQELPRDISKLVKLRHLCLEGCGRLTHMPKGFGNLRELQTLDWFIVGEDDISCSKRSKGDVSASLSELRDLNDLKGSLRIIVARESKYIVAEAKTAQLGRKDKLTSLTIQFNKNGKEDEMVLEALQPHGANLRYLEITSYGGEKLPSWMMPGQLHSLLPNLVDVHISYVDHCKYMYGYFDLMSKGPCLQFEIEIIYYEILVEWLPGWSKILEQLKMGPVILNFAIPKGDGSRALTIHGLMIKDKLESSQSRSGRPDFLFKSCFPNLQELIIYDIPELEVLPAELRGLSSLKYLKFEHCPKLKALPDSIGSLASLECLTVLACRQLKELPYSIGNLTSLRRLWIQNCTSLETLPHNISKLSQLTKLQIDVQDWNPDSIGSLTSLIDLEIKNCPRVESFLLHQISNLSQLSHLSIYECSEALLERCRKPTGDLWPYIQHISKLDITSFR